MALSTVHVSASHFGYGISCEGSHCFLAVTSCGVHVISTDLNALNATAFIQFHFEELDTRKNLNDHHSNSTGYVMGPSFLFFSLVSFHFLLASKGELPCRS